MDWAMACWWCLECVCTDTVSEGHQCSQCSWSTLSTSMINTMSNKWQSTSMINIVNAYDHHQCLWSTLSINVSEQNSMSMINTSIVYGHQCLWSTSMINAVNVYGHRCLWSTPMINTVNIYGHQCLWPTPMINTVNIHHEKYLWSTLSMSMVQNFWWTPSCQDQQLQCLWSSTSLITPVFMINTVNGYGQHRSWHHDKNTATASSPSSGADRT